MLIIVEINLLEKGNRCDEWEVVWAMFNISIKFIAL